MTLAGNSPGMGVQSLDKKNSGITLATAVITTETTTKITRIVTTTITAVALVTNNYKNSNDSNDRDLLEKFEALGREAQRRCTLYQQNN